MTTFAPAYRLELRAPRSVDAAEATVLSPVAGAAHSDPFRVSTLPNDTGWKPYLVAMPEGRSGKVNRLTKKTDVGVRSFRLVDPALTSGDNLTRWLTAFTGDLKGKLRIGNLKALAWESVDGGATWTQFWTGRVRKAELVQPNVFTMHVRELADDQDGLAFVGRPHASVTQAGFTTLLPIGSSIAVGTLPKVKPLTGTMGTAVFGMPSTQGIVTFDAVSRDRKDNLITRNLLEAVQPPTPQFVVSGQTVMPTFRGTARARLKRLDTLATGTFKVGLVPAFHAWPSNHWRGSGCYLEELPTGSVGYLAMPPATTAVEVTIEAEGAASKQEPLIVDGLTWPQMWKRLLQGYFGFLWTPPEELPGGVAYGDPRSAVAFDTAKFATLEADTRFPPMRWFFTKRESRGKVIDRENRIANLAYYRDGTGKIVPVDLRLPSDVSATPTIADSDLVIPDGGQWPTWSYDREQAVTRVDGAYYTDLPQSVDDLNASPDRYPVLKTGVFDELRYPVEVIDLGNSDVGDEPYELDATGFRTMAGESLNGQARGIYLQRRLIDLALETARPFQAGETIAVLPVRRGGAGDAQPGELRKCTVTTLVDPGTNKRGGTRLVQVLERTPRKAWIDLTVIDLGLSTTAQTPALAAPAQEAGNTTSGATSAVTLGAGGHPVEVHYAVTETSVGAAPAEGAAEWTPYPGGIIRANSTVTVRQLPAGKRIWFRGRSFPDARVDYKLPSAWGAAAGTGRVDLATLAAPSAPAGSLQTASSFRVSWTNGDATLGTEVLMAEPVGDPRVPVCRMVPGSTFVDLPGDVDGLVLAASTTFRIGLRSFSNDGSVSAEVTVDVSTTGVASAAPDTGGFVLLVGKP